MPHSRQWLWIFATAVCSAANAPKITTLIEARNPYGIRLGPDGGLYYCEIDRHSITRLDLKTLRATTVAGTGVAGYSGDGGPATAAAMNQPYDIAFAPNGDLFEVEMPNHVVRRIDAATHMIQTVAGTGQPGFSGDGGPGTKAQLRQPHSIALIPSVRLLICDIMNRRIRSLDIATGAITTFAGTGSTEPTSEGAKIGAVALNGPRAIALDPAGNLYIVLREGNAIYRVDARTQTIARFAGTGAKGYSGDGGPALDARFNGPKGISTAPDGSVYIADTENHAIRRIDRQGIVTTVAGTGERGDGPDGDPLKCRLSRPHGVFVGPDGAVYIADSESNRIRILK